VAIGSSTDPSSARCGSPSKEIPDLLPMGLLSDKIGGGLVSLRKTSSPSSVRASGEKIGSVCGSDRNNSTTSKDSNMSEFRITISISIGYIMYLK
jgi:hypothetical protein